MLFKFVILFQSFNAILNPIVLSTISLLLMSRHSIPIIQCIRLFPFPSTHTLSHFNFQQNRCDPARFCAIPFAIFVYSIPFLSAHPSFYFASQLFPQLHFANAVVKLLFPSTFSPLCPSNNTNQNAATITQIVVHLLQLYNLRHFQPNRHSVSHFDSTSTRLHSTSTY